MEEFVYLGEEDYYISYIGNGCMMSYEIEMKKEQKELNKDG